MHEKMRYLHDGKRKSMQFHKLGLVLSILVYNYVIKFKTFCQLAMNYFVVNL